MRYLYGDGVESALSINYLEYLRLVLEFSAAVLKSQTHVEAQNTAVEKQELFAKKELEHLRTLQHVVNATLDQAGAELSKPTVLECIGKLRATSKKEIDSAEEALRFNFSRNLRQIQKTIDWERAENERRLEKVLLHYDLPASEHRMGLRAFDENGYEVELTIRSDLGVDAVILLSVPESHRLSRPLRVDSIDPDLAVTVPQNVGWGRKNLKHRLQKLTKEYVVALTYHPEGVVLTLRNAFPAGQSGHDIVFKKGQVAVTRVLKQQAEEPFAADPEDAAKLTALTRALLESLGTLSNCRRVLKSVDFEGVPLCQHTEPTKLVRHLLTQTGPEAREIAAHSLSQGELVLKRVLGDDRREEIFVSVAELKHIYADLTESQRNLFSPLGFDEDATRSVRRSAGGVVKGTPSPSVPRPFSSFRTGPSSAPPTLPKPSLPPAPEPSPEPVSDSEDSEETLQYQVRDNSDDA